MPGGVQRAPGGVDETAIDGGTVLHLQVPRNPLGREAGAVVGFVPDRPEADGRQVAVAAGLGAVLLRVVGAAVALAERAYEALVLAGRGLPVRVRRPARGTRACGPQRRPAGDIEVDADTGCRGSADDVVPRRPGGGLVGRRIVGMKAGWPVAGSRVRRDPGPDQK